MIDNYKNSEQILSTTDPTDAEWLDPSDSSLIDFNIRSIDFGSRIGDVLEFHAYDLNGNWLAGNHSIGNWGNNPKYKTDELGTRRLYLDVHKNIRDLGFVRGEYKVVYNFNRNWIGRYQNPTNLFIKTISPSKTELVLGVKITGEPSLDDQIFKEIDDLFESIEGADQEFRDEWFDTFSLNFSNNNLLKVINIRRIDENDIAVKLYEALPDSLGEKSRCWLASQIRQPYVDNIVLIPPDEDISGNTIQGPNFHLDINQETGTETDYKTWSDLLGSNTQTSQQIIDHYFSGSLSGIKLNIQYGDFENFVHYSSAEERVKNFKYKLELIEFYNVRLSTLGAVTGSTLTNVADTTAKRNAVISGFDDFENWLYFESGSQELYTYQSNSISPWPKVTTTKQLSTPLTWVQAMEQWVQNQSTWLTGSLYGDLVNATTRPYTLLATTSSAAVTYYNNLVNQAKLYDQQNESSLLKSVPEHIRLDPYNSDYDIFINMIGHHYDILWTYVNHLSRVYSREEHPQDGMSDDLIYDAAKSFGWTLTNGNSRKNLWEYALGYRDESGTIKNAGYEIPSKTEEKLTKEVWRRILNSLPHLLKQKGTSRSIRAMASCYGVPATLLTIREYGGPKISTVEPKQIKYQYDHALRLVRNNYLETKWDRVRRKGSWQYPDNITLRVWASKVNPQAQTIFQSGGSLPKFYVNIESTGSKSTNANLHFYLSGSLGYQTASILDATIFDNDFFLLSVGRNISSTDGGGNSNTKYNFYVKKHKYGNLTTNASASFIISGSEGAVSQSYNNSWNSAQTFRVGYADNPSSTVAYSGSIQELRYWTVALQESVLDGHTVSPSSYYSNEATGAFDDLAFRIPLLDKKRLNDSAIFYTAHPNQKETYFTSSVTMSAEVKGAFPLPANQWREIEEEHYIPAVSIGGKNIYSDKIRVETNTLTRGLSPTNRAEKNAFDNAPLDSNRIGVYFSPQNNINDDIYKHIGFTELDDYFGDPSHQFLPDYPDLRRFANNYWKKYRNKNDIAAYLRIFSLYDFSMFKQIKKLLPARASCITGLVIEPNILERNTISSKKIQRTEHLYKVNISDPEPSLTGSVPYYTSSVQGNIASATGSLSNYTSSIQALTNFITASAQHTVTATDSNAFSSSYSDTITATYGVSPALYSRTSLIRSASVWITSSTPYWRSDPTMSFIGNTKPSLTKQLPGYRFYYETEYKSPATASQFTASNIAWSVFTTSSLFPVSASSIGLDTSGSTYLMVLSDFGFNLPAHSTIKGIRLTVGKYADSSSLSDNNVYFKDRIVSIGKTDDFTTAGSNLAKLTTTGFTSSWHNAQSAATSDQGGGLPEWANVSNITGSYPNTYASMSTQNNEDARISNSIKGYNFGFSIPENATIDGVEARILRTIFRNGGSGAIVTDEDVNLFKNAPANALASPSQDTNAAWPNTLTHSGSWSETYGGSANIWYSAGNGLTATEVNNLNFGLGITTEFADDDAADPTASLDVYQMQLRVYYQDAEQWATSSGAVSSYGSYRELWGQSWDRSEINAPEFSVKLKANYSGSHLGYLESAKIKVYYQLTASAETASVSDDLPRGIENHRYLGCQMTSPGINQPSDDTVDKGPVVEVTKINPSNLIMKPISPDGGVFAPVNNPFLNRKI